MRIWSNKIQNDIYFMNIITHKTLIEKESPTIPITVIEPMSSFFYRFGFNVVVIGVVKFNEISTSQWLLVPLGMKFDDFVGVQHDQLDRFDDNIAIQFERILVFLNSLEHESGVSHWFHASVERALENVIGIRMDSKTPLKQKAKTSFSLWTMAVKQCSFIFEWMKVNIRHV